jgi:hypothetical protein
LIVLARERARNDKGIGYSGVLVRPFEELVSTPFLKRRCVRPSEPARLRFHVFGLSTARAILQTSTAADFFT